MLDGISSRAWSEWQTFWHLYGFGEKRMDVRFAQLMALIANLVRGKDAPAVSIDDILPDDDDDSDEAWGEYDESGMEQDEVADEDQLIFEAMLREAVGDAG